MSEMEPETKILLLLLVIKIAVSWGESGKIDSLYREAMDLYSKKRYSEVIPKLKTFLETNPDHYDACFLLGMAYHQEKKEDQAVSYLSRYLNQSPLNNLARLQSAYQVITAIYRQDKNWDRIISVSELYRKRLQTVEKSEEYAKTAIPVLVHAHNSLGEYFYQKNDYESARKHYLSSLQYDEKQTWIWEKLANCYLQLNRRQDAVSAFTKALSCPNVSWSYQLNLVSSLIKASENEERLKEATEKIPPEQPAWYTLKVLSLTRQKNFPEALSLLRKAEATLQTKGEFAIRVLKLVQEQTPEGMEFFLLGLQSYPFAPGSTSFIETLLGSYSRDPEKQKQLKNQIVNVMDRIIADNLQVPESQEVAFFLISLRFRYEEETEQSIRSQLEEYRKFVENYPESKFVLQALQRQADIYRQKLNDWEKAASIYTELIEKKNQKHLIPSLASCQAKLGNYQEAINLLRSYLKERSSDFSISLQLAETLLEAGITSEGISLLQNIVSSNASQYLKDSANKLLKAYRQVIPEGYTLPAGRETGIFLHQKTQHYYFTNAPSLKPSDPLLYQCRRSISVYPCSSNFKTLPLRLSVSSSLPFSLTEPYTLLEQENNLCQACWKFQAKSSSQPWRKEETYTIFFPWAEVQEKKCGIERVYQEESDGSVTLLISVSFPFPGKWRLEVYSTRWQKMEKIEPQPDQRSGEILTYQNLSGEKTFTVTLKGKLPSSVQYNYPRVTLSHLLEGTVPHDQDTDDWFYQESGWQYRIKFPERVYIVQTVKQEEITYQLDEKIEWR